LNLLRRPVHLRRPQRGLETKDVRDLNPSTHRLRQYGIQSLVKEIRASISRPSSSEGNPRAPPHPRPLSAPETTTVATTRPLASLSVEEVQPETRNPKPETQNPKSEPETRNPRSETRNSKAEADTRSPKPERCARCCPTWAWASTRRPFVRGGWTARASTRSTLHPAP